MAKTTKPTKQQIAQAKARAGGNNPVKVTNAGLKKLGGAALIAASMTPAGRAVKAATSTRGIIKVATKVAGKKVVGKALDKAAGKSVVSAAKSFTKEAAREKQIIAKLDKAHPKAQAKAQKIINKAVKKNPNLFK
jgi:hypothetical protein